MTETSPGVVITLREVWEQGQETREIVGDLANSVGELVAVNRRLDAHSNAITEHDHRLDKLEIAQAVVAATTPRRAPWYSIVGGIVGIATGIIAVVTLIGIATKLAGG